MHLQLIGENISKTQNKEINLLEDTQSTDH
jgi:hypothetical protein